jgi:hypothetical protein
MAGEEGFLSRWSRRKQDVREGKPVVEEERANVEEANVEEAKVEEAKVKEALVAPPPSEPEPPAPTLEDVQSLTPDSDFRRFVSAGVDPQVKAAAVKKLFADPRYNVRDAMDVYADDYSIPDPLPESMLRKMASAQFLKLFEEKDTDAPPRGADDPADGGSQSVAEYPPSTDVVPEPPDADPDLRLQQDDAPAGESAGDGIERGPGAAHDAVPPPGGRLPEGGAG